MNGRIRSAIDHLYRATDLGCDCTAPPHITAAGHIVQHIAHAIAILEKEALPNLRCDNCAREFHHKNKAYRIQKGSIAELARHMRSLAGDPHSLLLCPRCYDNSWVIGRADDV